MEPPLNPGRFIYDMCKAADRGMTITDVKLLKKQGGKSGHWVAENKAV